MEWSAGTVTRISYSAPKPPEPTNLPPWKLEPPVPARPAEKAEEEYRDVQGELAQRREEERLFEGRYREAVARADFDELAALEARRDELPRQIQQLEAVLLRLTIEREARRYHELKATLPGLHAEADRLQLLAANAVAEAKEAWNAHADARAALDGLGRGIGRRQRDYAIAVERLAKGARGGKE